MSFLGRKRAAYQLALALGLALGYSVIVSGYVAAAHLKARGEDATAAPRISARGAGWSRPLRSLKPYAVQPGYGTGRGITCDLAVYTTNAAALDGKGRLRPGDATATVGVNRQSTSLSSRCRAPRIKARPAAEASFHVRARLKPGTRSRRGAEGGRATGCRGAPARARSPRRAP